MDTTRFINNFLLFKEALRKQNFNNKELNTTSMQAALQCEQLALNEQAQDLQSEQVRAKMQDASEFTKRQSRNLKQVNPVPSDAKKPKRQRYDQPSERFSKLIASASECG